MNHMHTASLFEWLLILLSLVSLLAYFLAARYQRRCGRTWPPWRDLLFCAGVVCIIAALSPPMAAWGHQDFRGHMVQHLLLGMFAPLGLVLAAPISLLLKSLPRAAARFCTALLQTPLMGCISHPAVALVLNVGSLWLLYLSPLYAASLQNAALHGWLHLHFIVAGCLFTWSIAGPDPALKRPSAEFRLVVLFAAMATHALLAKVIYAYQWPRWTNHSLDELQAGAQWMYYGGDLAELLLLIALLVQWPLRWMSAYTPNIRLPDPGSELTGSGRVLGNL